MNPTRADLRAITEGQRAYAGLRRRNAPASSRRQLPALWLAVLAIALLALAAFVLWPTEAPRRVALDGRGPDSLTVPLAAAAMGDEEDPRRRPHRWIAMARPQIEAKDPASPPEPARALR